MDAHALLTSQGWRGTGHSLHPTSSTIGLKRPLLVSQKQNTLGIGKKQHRTSDMWWMNAFDKSLKGLDTSKEGQVTQTAVNGGLDMVAKGGGKWVGGGGLYDCFVRGEGLGGTMEEEERELKKREMEEGVRNEGGKKRKAHDEETAGAVVTKKKKNPETQSKEEGRALKRTATVRIQADLDASAPEPVVDIEIREETKDERKARRALKRAKSVSFAEVIEESTTADVLETKEERKARRANKRAAKALKASVEELVSKEPENNVHGIETKAERKERKRQKKEGRELLERKESEVVPDKPTKKKRRKD